MKLIIILATLMTSVFASSHEPVFKFMEECQQDAIQLVKEFRADNGENPDDASYRAVWDSLYNANVKSEIIKVHVTKHAGGQELGDYYQAYRIRIQEFLQVENPYLNPEGCQVAHFSRSF